MVNVWDANEPLHYKVPKSRDPWKSCHDQVKDHESEVWQGRERDIDNMLLFAGLFSGVVTGFTLETFQWLQQDPADETVVLLRTISQQLANRNVSVGDFDDDSVFTAEGYIVRVNIFFFLSLAISLIAALLGIMCKQWLYEHLHHIPVPTQRNLAVRYMRMRSIEKWGVSFILTCLPILLQLGLFLFFIGVVDLLWNVHHLVAWIFSVVAGVGLLFFLVTCMLPGIMRLFFPAALPCPYKSGQAWAFYRSLEWLYPVILPLLQKLHVVWYSKVLPPMQKLRAWLNPGGAGQQTPQQRAGDVLYTVRGIAHWHRLDLAHIDEQTGDGNEYLVGAIIWILDMFSGAPDTVTDVFHCLSDLEPTEMSAFVQGSPRSMLDTYPAPDQNFLPAFLSINVLGEETTNYLVEQVVRAINKTFPTDTSTADPETADAMNKRRTQLIAILKDKLPRTEPDWYTFPEDLSLQVIYCLSTYVEKPGVLSYGTLPSLWKINGDIIQYGSEKLRTQALDLLPKLENWLERDDREEIARGKRRACVQVLLSWHSTTLLMEDTRKFLLFAQNVENHFHRKEDSSLEWKDGSDVSNSNLQTQWRRMKMALGWQP